MQDMKNEATDSESLLAQKDDELDGYSQDEIQFLNTEGRPCPQSGQKKGSDLVKLAEL